MTHLVTYCFLRNIERVHQVLELPASEREGSIRGGMGPVQYDMLFKDTCAQGGSDDGNGGSYGVVRQPGHNPPRFPNELNAGEVRVRGTAETARGKKFTRCGQKILRGVA